LAENLIISFEERNKERKEGRNREKKFKKLFNKNYLIRTWIIKIRNIDNIEWKNSLDMFEPNFVYVKPAQQAKYAPWLLYGNAKTNFAHDVGKIKAGTKSRTKSR